MNNDATHPLIEEADALRLEMSSIEALQARIPAGDDELHTILHDAVAASCARAFTLLTVAALEAGREVDAAVLIHGARLLPHPGYIARLGARLSGDVSGALVAAVEDGRLSWEKEAIALYVAAWLNRERGLTGHNEAIVRRTRMLSRKAVGFDVQSVIVATATLLEDEELDVLASRLAPGRFPDGAERVAAMLMAQALGPLVSELDTDDGSVNVATRRRAVARVGRNEPCPCGSGKKYKRCCFDKDQERNRDASDVAGVTRAEIRRELEDFLTLDRIHELSSYELARLDPSRIDAELYGPILNQLTTFGEFEALANFFDVVGVEGREGYFIDAVDQALAYLNVDAAKALLKVYDPREEECIGFPLRFLKRNVEGGEALELLEDDARDVVDEFPITFAIDLLRSRWPSLGILVARGAAPLSGAWDRVTLLEELGLARDRLGLPAIDPTEDIHDLWGWEDDLDDAETPPPRSESPRDDSVSRELEAKEAELGRVRREMSALREQLESHAEETALRDEPAAVSAESVSHPSDARVAELKERVARLKGELNQRHAERNQLKRQLEREQTRANSLEAQSRRAAEPAAADEKDDEWGAPELDATIPLPFRFPTYTKRLRSSLEHIPEATRKQTLILATRIAAGDQAAFRGVRRLEVDHTIWRCRVGRDYRMLFRLGNDELEVLDIVPRQGLERALRDLT
jgi:hypothetical protein